MTKSITESDEDSEPNRRDKHLNIVSRTDYKAKNRVVKKVLIYLSYLFIGIY